MVAYFLCNNCGKSAVNLQTIVNKLNLAPHYVPVEPEERKLENTFKTLALKTTESILVKHI